ncbi:MAG: S8 family serine peptidase [candidate division Zixibacteria bacterium]|nr:S8 family serine peptidase [candidate division Zixibacteria bacterium]
MKKNFLLIFAAFMLLSGSLLAADAVIKVDRDLDVPSFLGYVDDEFIIVVKAGVVSNFDSKLLSSNMVFESVPEFELLSGRFAVIQERQQFQGRKVSPAASAIENVMARHFKIKITFGTVDDAMKAYSELDAVESVQPIGIHSLYATPNDTYYDNPPASFSFDQWHYWDTHSIDADLAWDTQTGDATVVVGILDSGTRYFHTDLGGNNAPWGPNNPQINGNIWINGGETAGDGIDNDGNGYIDDIVGYDFVSSTNAISCSCKDQDCDTADNDPDDGDGHGTHVSGTVAAITNNGRAVAGIAGGFSDGTTSGAGNGSKIMALRIGWHARCMGFITGVVRMDYAAEAMNYVADQVDAGVNVAAINCSWGSSNSGGLGAAVDNLLAHDVVIVVAAGNSNSTNTSYLSSRGDCLDVAATDRNGIGASFTNHGPWVDVAAPGVDIMSTYANPDDADLTHNYVALLSGTSMSAPHICGILALLESCNPALTGPQKFNLIVNNTDPYTDSRDLGSGIANANKALSAASCATCAETTPVANFSGTPTSGDTPLTVSFTDASSNNPATWSWDFGDGANSSEQNPSHEYSTAGTFTVALTASNCAGSGVETKVDYITVTTPPAATEMLVFDIVVSRIKMSKGFKTGTADITIFDANSQPVENATVTGNFSGKTSETGLTALTNASGVATFLSASVKGGGEWCFEVTNVTHVTLTYNSFLNNVTQSCESGDLFSVGEPIISELPNDYVLLQNHPNPFNPSTNISFTLPQSMYITLEVFNVAGQRIAMVAVGSFSSGEHTVTWNAERYSSGVYFYRLTRPDLVQTKKMLLLK